MKKASLFVLFLTVFIDLIGFGMVIPFLSFYAREYGASGVVVGAVVGVYSIMQFFFAPVWGRLSDRIGRRPVILVSLAASFIGYLLFALSRSLTVLFISRIIAGAGGANIGTAQAYITDVTSPEERARGMGLIGAAFGMGFILGPPLSAFLSSIGAQHGLHDNLLPGLAAAALSLTALIIAFSVLVESKPEGLVSRRALPPQFDARIWRDVAKHSLLAATITALFLTLLAVAGMETSVTLHARDRFHFRQRDMGWFFLFMGVIVAVIQGALIGRFAKKIGERALIMIGAISFTIAFLAAAVDLARAAALRRRVLHRDRPGRHVSLADVADLEGGAGERARQHPGAGHVGRIAGTLPRPDSVGVSLRSRRSARRVLRCGVPGTPRSAGHNLIQDGELMSILKVARLGHPVLRQKASDVEIKDIKAGKFNALIDDMVETMHAYEGVGLAGPQVHLPLRVFVFEVQEKVAKRRGVKSVGVGVFFNATYEPVGTETITDWEGCLSVPFLGGEVPRYKRLLLRGFDHEGEEAEIEIEDFTARIFQHEVDHTDGHVYLDRMPDLTTLGYTIVL